MGDEGGGTTCLFKKSFVVECYSLARQQCCRCGTCSQQVLTKHAFKLLVA